MNKKKLIWIIIPVLFIAGLVWLIRTPGKPGALDSFAMCINDSGAKFYGAYWCPHCVEQKELFGASEKRLPYIECSPAGPSAPQATECKEKDIKGYPTWIINGTRYTGLLSLDTLAQYSNYKSQGGNS